MDTQQDTIKKRGRLEDIVDFGLSELNIPEKKRKIKEIVLDMYNSEVGETSLNWSQLNRRSYCHGTVEGLEACLQFHA